MKNLILAITLILSFSFYAQNRFEDPNIFVRVYDLKGKKINKGKILSISDTLLLLKRGEKTIKVPVKEIGKIKTKHSAGHNILVGSVAGAASMTLISAASPSDSDSFINFSTGQKASFGALLGAPGGAVIGGISCLFKKTKTYIINADPENWMAFKEEMLL